MAERDRRENPDDTPIGDLTGDNVSNIADRGDVGFGAGSSADSTNDIADWDTGDVAGNQDLGGIGSYDIETGGADAASGGGGISGGPSGATTIDMMTLGDAYEDHDRGSDRGDNDPG